MFIHSMMRDFAIPWRDDALSAAHARLGVVSWRKQWWLSAVMVLALGLWVTLPFAINAQIPGLTAHAASQTNLTVIISSGTNPVRGWTRIWGSIADDAGSFVVADKAGNAYVTGTTEGSLVANRPLAHPTCS
jgi:hypothetical protein